ncbi:hypothetical protein [Synechococcus sp. MIT S9452]|uniref:hypothetical protein n=1 Tax=Synechococcus sp. MIT S9452 TaxID=3082546 RepID=UPI0039A6647A
MKLSTDGWFFNVELLKELVSVFDFAVEWPRVAIEMCCVTGAIILGKRFQEASFFAATFLIGLTIVELFLGFVVD